MANTVARAARRACAWLSAHRRAVGAAAGLVLAAAVGTAAWTLAPAWGLLGRFAATATAQPSRLYASPPVLVEGAPGSRRAAIRALAAASYVAGAGPPRPGRYAVAGGRLRVNLRRFPTAAGLFPGGLAEIAFADGRVQRLVLDGRPVAELVLEPPLLHAFLGSDRQERRPLRLAALPDHVVHAVLAAEDDGFFRHPGVSLPGIARAAWVNLRSGEVRQGGSTITQQLVKNLYLSSERTVTRKAREGLLALLLEARHGKPAILEAYLNQVYLGAAGGCPLLGLGAAARAYFGVAPDQLTVTEAATLAGMISSPARYSPVAHPEAARARRDWVLGRMAEQGWLDAGSLASAAATPLTTLPLDPAPSLAPHFARQAAREAAARFGVTALETDGVALLGTLVAGDQEAAEAAVAAGLADLETGSRRGPLEAALVSLDPHDGGILAWVGGRDFRRSQFDRAGDAHRQAGSAFKPVVAAAALAEGVATPATLVADEPLEVPTADGVWAPRDDDGRFLGPITLRAAIEQSRNLPFVRLALDTGVGRIVATGRALGLTSPLDPVPALALGAAAVTPLEMATAYATLAAGGRRPTPHALAAVLDGRGEPLSGTALPRPVPALDPAVAYVVTSLLQGVLDRGTGVAARRLGVADAVAGKTGTSNDGRDAWFCGFSPERATAVWVGRDDDAPAGLSGAAAALPIWARFTRDVRPPGGYREFVPPAGIVTAVIDPVTGGLATTACPATASEVFLAGHVPTELCPEHRGFLVAPLPQPDGVEVERPGRFRRFLMRVFGARGRPD